MTPDPTIAELMRPGPDAIDALVALLERPAWHRHAACRGMGHETWFPRRGEPLEPAKAVCARCPVRVQCELDARRTAAEGVWGGTSARERRKARRAA